MPIKKSAKKHLRASEKRKKSNDKTKKAMRETIKKTNLSITNGKKDSIQEDYKKAQASIDKAVKKGIIKKKAGARKKSRLIKKIKTIK